MQENAKTPVAGEFTSQGGRRVKVRCATFSQAMGLAEAAEAGSFRTMAAVAALVDELAEVEGLPADARPSGFLTVADCQKAVKIAQGSPDADFT